MSSVVGVLFLCSYRDYKDCSASNSEKRTGGRPAGCAAEEPERKTMNLAPKCNVVDCVGLSPLPGSSILPSSKSPLCPTPIEATRVAASINAISADWDKKGRECGWGKTQTRQQRPYISRLIKHKADAGTGKATESMEGCIA